MTKIRANISPKRSRLFVFFDTYDKEDVSSVKQIPGARYSPSIGGWRMPLDLTTGRALRRAFGERLELSPELTDWARGARRREREAHTLAMADDHAIERLAIAETQPELAAFLRPYQRSAVAHMSKGSCINGDDMGLGKTVSTIAALAEQGAAGKPALIVAPKSALESVWAAELDRWARGPRSQLMIIEGGSIYADPAQAHDQVRRFADDMTVVCTAEMFRRHFDWMKDWQPYSFIIDEFHITGLTDGSTKPGKGSQFFQKAMKLPCQVKYGLSGTPIGGQPIKLWSALHWIAPDVFRSKWQWVYQWLVVSKDYMGHQEIGGIKPELQEEFWRYHAPYLIRRKKEEVAKELPPKQRIVIRCDMTASQRKQYRTFAKEAEIIIQDKHLIATNKLSELSRLRAFASARCQAERRRDGTIKLIPDVTAGGKYASLMERLAESGIGQERQAVVATTFRGIATGLYLALSKKYNCGLIMGGVTARKRRDLIHSFQQGELEVMVMTSRAGGVAINLDRADHIHIFDEDWNPDVQSQLEDRLHRISRIHQVTCFYYRTRGTVEEEVNQTVTEKSLTNYELLDKVRQSLKGIP